MMEDAILSNPYRQNLASYNLVSGIEYLAKCSLQVPLQPEDMPLVRFSDQTRGISVFSKPYNMGMMAYIASELISNAIGDKPFDLQALNESIDFVNSDFIGRSKYDKTSSNFKGIQIFLTALFPQLSMPSGRKIVSQFSRSILLYLEFGVQPETISFAQLLELFSGFMRNVSIEEYILAGMVIYALSVEGEGKILPWKVGNGIIINGVEIKQEKVNIVLENISITPADFKMLMNRTVSEEFHYHTLLNPLYRFPIIRINESFYSPVPQLILQRCTGGIFDDFREKLNHRMREKFSYLFGQVFEKYIRSLLENTNPKWMVYPEQLYENNSLKSSDLILLEDNIILLVECKSKRMNLQVKTFMSKDRYDQEMSEIAHGIENIIRTRKHLVEDRLKISGLNINSNTLFLGVVVTMDEYAQRTNEAVLINAENGAMVEINTWPVKEYLMEIVKNQITKSSFITQRDFDNFPPENIQVFSVDDFEMFCGSLKLGINTLKDLSSGRIGPNIPIQLFEIFEKYLSSVIQI